MQERKIEGVWELVFLIRCRSRLPRFSSVSQRGKGLKVAARAAGGGGVFLGSRPSIIGRRQISDDRISDGHGSDDHIRDDGLLFPVFLVFVAVNGHAPMVNGHVLAPSLIPRLMAMPHPSSQRRRLRSRLLRGFAVKHTYQISR